MKTVFKSAEIPHIWASQNHEHGRSRGNASFQGEYLRSYSTDIGRIIEPGRAVLLNLTSYSVSTSKIQGRMHSAVNHYPVKFFVRGLDRGSVLRDMDGRKLHDYYTRASAQCVTDSQKPRIRQTTREGLLAQASSYLEDANRANEFFKLRRAVLTHADVETVAKRIRNRDATQVRADEKRASMERERRAAQMAHAMAEIRKVTPVLQKLWRDRQEESDAWLNIHETLRDDDVSLRSDSVGIIETTADGFEPNALLRLSQDQTRVETTQGAQVLVRTVRFLWEFCCNARDQGSPIDQVWVSRFPVLDHYRVNEIDAHGNVTAGCHRISFAEIEGIARTLKLPPFNGEAVALPDFSVCTTEATT